VTGTECEIMLVSLSSREHGTDSTFKPVLCYEMTLPNTTIRVRCETMT